MRNSLVVLAQHAAIIVALGGTLSTLCYAVWVVRSVQAQMEVLEQKLMTTEQKLITTEEKIKTAKVEAIKESTENYMKYNHSAEFSSLQKSNASRGAE